MSNNMNSSGQTIMPSYAESDEEDELESYNINDEPPEIEVEHGQESDCSEGSSSAASSSKTGLSSSSSESTSNLTLDNEDDVDGDEDDSVSPDDDDTYETTTQSDELELAQLTAQHTFRLPRGLCESASIFNEFFSLDTWQLLPPAMQAQLLPLLPNFAPLLPPTQAAAEQQRTITQLFNGGVQRFGHAPLATLQRQLEEGSLRPDVLQLRRSISHSKRRELRFQHCERLSQLAKELFLSREQLLRHAYSTPPPPAEAKDKEAGSKRPPRGCRKRKPQQLLMDNKFCALRARKRYCLELYELGKELELELDISADEEDAEALTPAEREAIAREWAPPAEPAAPSKSSNAADKKCIYSTFFKRRHGVDDEHVLRQMQAAKVPRLHDRNFKKYLRDYKRRKLAEPELADFDTTDIRLRDVCTRAQFVGSFKPGRKPKALTARLNEPPALVPIGAATTNTTKSEPAKPLPAALPEQLLTDEPQQVYGRAAVEDDDDEGLELEVLGYEDVSQLTPPKPVSQPQTLPLPSSQPQTLCLPIKPLPKLEPIVKQQLPLSRPKAQLPTQLQQQSQLQSQPLLKSSAGHITGSPTRETPLPAESQPQTASCYFSLLRDFFVATPHYRMTYAELHALVLAQSSSTSASSAAGDWQRALPDWTQLLQSAINFLSGDFVALPVEYVPYIEHKTQLNIYQWIGAGRDSDARLLALCNYWQQRRKEQPQQQQTQQQLPSPTGKSNSVAPPAALSPVESCALSSPTPPPRCPTSWTVRTASQAEMLEFQRQERLRFEQPHRPFTYRLNGYESVVGPVKGIYQQSFSLNKARGHAVMIDDRPPYVTILTLVRDATARLPNGEGTRAEISELLKCSQFVNHQAAETVLQTIVSGALDRMHGGVDPCVKYDARRKIWIYLHRNRSETEFERMHKYHQSLGKQNKRNKTRKKEELVGAEETTVPELPALVPAASATTTTTTTTTLLVKPLPTPLSLPLPAIALPTKCPPVPPLKYHIPAASSQKSLLKTPLQTSLQTTTVKMVKSSPPPPIVKPYSFAPTTISVAAAASSSSVSVALQTKLSPSPARHTTPILVSTPTGLQTVHVATNPSNSSTAVAAKKLTLTKKPIIINHLGPGKQQQQRSPQQPASQPVGSFIIPLEQTLQSKDQPQLQTARPPMPKNIIRLLPAGASSSHASTITTPTVLKPPTGAVQIIGPRVLAQTTVRPLQQKIGAVSIVSSNVQKPTPIASSPGPGTMVKMTPQAFASLQQKQLLTKGTTVGGNNAASPQSQQRILVGNTAISSNKNIIFQALPASAAAQSKATPTIAQPTKILATSSSSGVSVGVSGIKTLNLNHANLSPQQQRIVLQNFKQQATMQFKPVGEAKPGMASAASQTGSRLVRTTVTPAATSAAAPQTGQIITLDSLIQKQSTATTTVNSVNSSGKLLTSSSIIHLTSSSGASQLVSPPRSIITLAPQGTTTQQRLVTQSTAPKLATGRIVSSNINMNAVPKIIGKTTVLPGGAGGVTKPLLLHAKPGVTLKNVTRTTAPQNIVIGGQTVKLQGTATLPRQINATGASSSAPLQTVIMGNQLVRLQHVVSTAAAISSNTNNTSSSTTTTTATIGSTIPTTSSGIASAPKTLVIGAGGQTLRLQPNAMGKNMLLANKSVNAAAGQNLVFAVQAGGGGQLFFSPTLQGVNLKPLSNMKVIPMTSAPGVKLNVANANVTAKLNIAKTLGGGSGSGSAN